MEKDLEVGKTLLGVTVAEYKGRIVPIKVYYGNYVTAKDKGDVQLKIDGEFIHQKPELYLKLLRDFLNSEEGRNYKVPTKEEVQSAVAKVLADEEMRDAEERRAPEKEIQKEEPKEKPAPKPVYIKDFEDDEEDEEEEAPVKKGKSKKGRITKEQMDELTLMYKRQANILTIAVIFLVLVVALQMLLNLYLLTR